MSRIAAVALIAFVCGQLAVALTACATHAVVSPAVHPRYYMTPTDATDALRVAP